MAIAGAILWCLCRSRFASSEQLSHSIARVAWEHNVLSSVNQKIFVTGHRGLVGRAVVRAIQDRGHCELLTCDRSDLDLRDPAAVETWFSKNRPDLVIHCAGRVGGIQANANLPVDFFYDNAAMHMNVLHAAWRHSVSKLLFLGSSCIYPRDCPQPIREEYLLTGPLEPTNEAYALAKVTGVRSCQYYREQYGCNFVAAMPTNLYGPFDNFDLETSHVLPALIRKFHDAKLRGEPDVVVWGTGTARREFLHVDDLAEACLFLMDTYNEAAPINIGTGVDISIGELAQLVRSIVYPTARIVLDASRPDGTPRKLLNMDRLHGLGWRHRIKLQEGIRDTYDWFTKFSTDLAN
ncbi:MAG: GDP-L-fucose synthase [Planctomycetales bacterium]|nr:GDP-L-fucose synthase [Planctomycetales bacterium]